jgi:hypothetical protein
VVCSDNNVEPSTGCGGSGIQWIEHTQPSLTNTITVQWTAPAAGSGNVHLYVSANATNGDNTPRGDHIYTIDYVLTPVSNATTGIPVITSIANATNGATTLEAGSWVTIMGSNFASAAATWDNAIIGNVFPTTLGGVTVAIDGRPAPISFVNQTRDQRARAGHGDAGQCQRRGLKPDRIERAWDCGTCDQFAGSVHISPKSGALCRGSRDGQRNRI